MAKQINLNEMTFPTTAASGIVSKRGVVQDATNRGNVKLPAGTPEKTFVGVATEKASAANNVTVQTHGIVDIESDGSAVINPGDYLILVGTTGRCKTQAIAAGSANVYNIIGICVNNAQIPATAGAQVDLLIMPFVVCAA